MESGLPAEARDEIDYPSRDGLPVGETDVHIDELVDLRALLRRRYRARDDVYVAGNLLVYYEEGNAAARFAPDVFVVFGVPNHNRRVYKLWVEGVAPSFVMEVSSRGTWLEDLGNKKALCARLGISEYFLFDPEAEYLEPPLQGFRLAGNEYRRIQSKPDGSIESKSLGLALHRDGIRLRCVDIQSGQKLLRTEELDAALRDAEARALAAEAELERTRRGR
jgi:Uma2 family endonuclease